MTTRNSVMKSEIGKRTQIHKERKGDSSKNWERIMPEIVSADRRENEKSQSRDCEKLEGGDRKKIYMWANFPVKKKNSFFLHNQEECINKTVLSNW